MRILDYLLRTGPYGDRFGEDPDGLSVAKLVEHPHGIDLGPLQPRLPDLLVTASGKIELAPPQVLEEAARLADTLDRSPETGLLLVGRRHLRSNNSWMHNLEVLVKGKERCTLQMHPDDALAAGIEHGAQVQVSNPTGSVTARAEITEDIMPGTVSLPHGWGHDIAGTRLSVAARRPGVNSNLLTSGAKLDALSGNAILNAIPVEVSKG